MGESTGNVGWKSRASQVMAGAMFGKLVELVWRNVWEGEIVLVSCGYCNMTTNLVALNCGGLFSHRSGGQKSEIKMLAGLCSLQRF